MLLLTSLLTLALVLAPDDRDDRDELPREALYAHGHGHRRAKGRDLDDEGVVV